MPDHVVRQSHPLIPAGEHTILSIKPSLWLILLYHGRRNLVLIGLAILLPRLLHAVGDSFGIDHATVGRAFWALLAILLFVDFLEWANRRYVLTNRRILRQRGILTRTVSDVPLERVQDIGIVRTLAERLLGLGTIGVSTAGGPMVPSWWLMVSRPGECLGRIRSAVDAARGGGGAGSIGGVVETARTSAPLVPAGGTEVDRDVGFLVVGLAGGIGSGKSEVARLLGEHGFVVVDSDAEARACLDRPEVRDRLVEWWGRRVLDAEGRVDRRVVAEIVFGDSKERARLESLVHPLVRRRREDLREEARRAGACGVVVDAPLLLEAGVDRECDVLVFVDAPRERRVERVRASRGWDEAELARREAAQMPLEAKRARCDIEIANDGGLEVLRERVSRLASVLRRGAKGGRRID
jgi:dephospho-CoA kinase